MASAIFAFFGLILATIAVIYAVKGWRISNDQHDEFLKELKAHSDFDIDVQLDSPPTGGFPVKTKEDRIQLVFKLTIKNTGNKAASETDLNVDLPWLADLQWSDSDGHKSEDVNEQGKPHDLGRWLATSDGETHPSRMLGMTFPRFPRVGQTQVFVSGWTETGESGTETLLPVRAEIWADELPRDGPESREFKFEFKVVRVEN